MITGVSGPVMIVGGLVDGAAKLGAEITGAPTGITPDGGAVLGIALAIGNAELLDGGWPVAFAAGAGMGSVDHGGSGIGDTGWAASLVAKPVPEADTAGGEVLNSGGAADGGDEDFVTNPDIEFSSDELLLLSLAELGFDGVT